MRKINLAIAVILFVGMSGCQNSQKRSKPNIIFILTDDQGYGDLGVFGHPYMKTPNIDRLAEEGTRFTQFHVNATVCSPSRVAFMTGQFPAHNNVHHVYFTPPEKRRASGIPKFLDPNVLTATDIMKQAGYTTGHFGKWHLCMHGRENIDLPPPSEYGVDYALTDIGTDRQDSLWQGRWKTAEHEITLSSHWIVDDGIDFIKKSREEDKPFYLNLWVYTPHEYLYPTAEELAVYENLQPRPEDFSSWMRTYADSTNNFTSRMRIFCAAMTSLDVAIGRLLNYLEQSGLAENTLLVFASDNGPEDYRGSVRYTSCMGTPGVFRGRKRSMYEGGVRVPCIVRWPGQVPAGKVSGSVWSGVDWLPTLAGITGVGLPSDYKPDGEDVSDILRGAERAHNKPLFWEWKWTMAGQEYLPPQLSVLEGRGRWKFYCNPDGSRQELYDLRVDPAERQNLIKERPDMVAELKEQLLDWKKTIPETAYPEDTK